VSILLNNSLETAKNDLSLAQRQALIARKICLRYNIRLQYSERQLFCRKCKNFIIPGINSRVRIGYRPKAIKIICLECNHIYRKIIPFKDDKLKC
jgi:ribonuclease P protein subunit RPR2